MHRRRALRVAIGVNVVASLVLAAILVALLNYLSSHFYLERDVRQKSFYRLSSTTLNLLRNLEDTVEINVVLRERHPDYEAVRNLVDEYARNSRRLKIRLVDPDLDLAELKDLKQEFDLFEVNVVVFSCGSRVKYVNVAELTTTEYADADMDSVVVGRRVFSGEQAFSSAIRNVSQLEAPTVYFLVGHGEGDISSEDASIGYSRLAAHVRRDNIAVRPLQIGDMKAIPRDCDVLVVAGPRRPLLEEEVAAINAYLHSNRGLILLLDPGVDPGLSDLFTSWGVRLANDKVVEQPFNEGRVYVTEYGSHEITRALRNVTTVLYSPRSIEPILDERADEAGGADRPRVSVLASCSAEGWAETDFDQSPPKLDPIDRPGPIPVAVAIEKGRVDGIDVGIHPARVVVVGDSKMMANETFVGGNVDFFMSSLNWALDRDELLPIAPRMRTEKHLSLSAVQQRFIFLCVVVAMPLAAALLGLFVRMARCR